MDFNSNGLNTSARLRDLRTFKSSIGNPTDFFFPVYGFKDQTHFAKEFGYHGLVESPGMAYIINTNSQDDVPNAVLNNIISCWSVVTLFMVITYLSGLAVWVVVSYFRIGFQTEKFVYSSRGVVVVVVVSVSCRDNLLTCFLLLRRFVSRIEANAERE